MHWLTVVGYGVLGIVAILAIVTVIFVSIKALVSVMRKRLLAVYTSTRVLLSTWWTSIIKPKLAKIMRLFLFYWRALRHRQRMNTIAFRKWRSKMKKYALAISLFAVQFGAGFAIGGGLGLLYVTVVDVLLLALLYFLARADKQAMFVPSGEIKAVVKGESVDAIFANIDGWHYDIGTGKIIPNAEGYEDNLGFLPKTFGIYWVSILYPLKQVHYYKFEWSKLLMPGHPVEKEDLARVEKLGGAGEYYLEHRDEWVNSLYWRATYPIVVEGVEILGNFKVDVVLNITFQVVYPRIPIFVFKGKWLAQVTAPVKGSVNDYGRGKDYDQFRAEKKQGENSGLAREIKKINFAIKRAGKPDLPGIEDTFGVIVYKVDFVKFDLSAKSQAAANATEAVEIARLNANARTEYARGEAALIDATGKADTRVLYRLLKVAKKHPFGAHVLMEQTRTKGLAAFRGGVLSLGGQGTPVVVSAEGSKQKPAEEATP